MPKREKRVVERGESKKDKVIAWLSAEKSHQHLSGASAAEKLRKQGIDVTPKYVNVIKKELGIST